MFLSKILVYNNFMDAKLLILKKKKLNFMQITNLF